MHRLGTTLCSTRCSLKITIFLFFTPKKDQCDTCATYENASKTEKNSLQEKYDEHQVEKELSRSEKASDKVSSNAAVAVYDLQAVFQLPKGDVSLFYYKSKLNVLNFTIYDLKSNNCDCYVWDESNGHCGVNELGSCVLDYIRKVCETGKKDVIQTIALVSKKTSLC